MHARTPSVAVFTGWHLSQWQSAADHPTLQRVLQLVDVTYTTFIYTLLHDYLDLVVDRVQVLTVWWPEVRTDEVRCLPLQLLDGVVGTMCRSTVLLKHKCVAYNCWKHLLRQQDIAVILAVHLHPRVDKYQFSHCRINKICNLTQNLIFLAFDIFPR